MTGSSISNGKRPADPADDESYSDSAPSSKAPSPSPSLSQRPFKRQAASEVPSSNPSSLQQQIVRDALPIIPTTVTTSPWYYGRINAENESNLAILKEVSAEMNHHGRVSLPRRSRVQSPAATTNGQDQDDDGHHHQAKHAVPPTPDADGNGSKVARQSKSHQEAGSSQRLSLTTLPAELIDTILSHLSAAELASSVSKTCRTLRKHAVSDFHWFRHVQSNVPGQALRSAGPCQSFRDLYAAHDPVWFLPRYKIWFCDQDLTGKLIVVRFDQRRGCIEGYQLVAVSKRPTFEQWPADNDVIIHGFEPQVKLHLDKPVLQFDVRDRQEGGNRWPRPAASRFVSEMPMTLGGVSGPMRSNLLLTRPLDHETADEKLNADYPYDSVWPPPTIPANHHVSGAKSGQAVVELAPDDEPRSRREVSHQTFRIRQWIQMPGTPSPPSLMGQAGRYAGQVQIHNGLTYNPRTDGIDMRGTGAAGVGAGVHIGEEIITYSTLDPVLYTPTHTKPWRGIWVGDYSGHGCEFLLINQPDDPPVSDAELGLVRGEAETDKQWQKRRRDAHMYRGRLEAIKLTGDPNVPRGEYTFVADDLGPAGYVGVASDPPFAGTRVVKSKGHVAATGFTQDKYIESQLLLIGPNRLAQYWVGFGHISFFERVHIDDFIVP